MRPGSTSPPPTTVRNFDRYRQDQILQRLKEAIPEIDGHLPSSGFRIAVVPCSFQSLPWLAVRVLDALNEALGLPNHNHHYSSLQSVFARPRAPDFSSITTVLTSNPHTNITGGVFYSDTAIEQFEKFISEFKTYPYLLLLPLLALGLTFDQVGHLKGHQRALQHMEGDTGYSLLNEKRDEGQLQDYRTLVKGLSKARSGVHLALATMRSTQGCTEFIMEKIPFVDQRFAPETREKLRDASRALHERTQFTLSAIQHAMLRGGLFNLVTQNDSLLSTSIAQDSREIAAASKRVSSSMKIIAFLTTFFLPAMFVATFFSMPLFDWDTPSIDSVATTHFWVYWALTAPLTLAIMVGVVTWPIWHSKSTRDIERKARQGFSQAIADEAQNLKRAATMWTLDVMA
ncbi:hypothetical protein BDW62DRAFT_212753 [Aspergillus aurantiobrunneus]